jgi:tetratricopeptide (TPR) repeat protein
VPIFEVGESDGQQYFTMALVEGESLARRLASGPLPASDAAEVIRNVALAVQFAHERGIVHRDLKPGNILFDASGRVRVTDFGLAKCQADGTGLTHTGQLLGTPSFMSPEQVSGDPDRIGPATDVYALGATLYTLISGRPPFQAASAIDTLRQVLDKEPIPPRELDSTLPRDLDTITLKCLEKNPQQRYESAGALADDLGRFLRNEPIEAVPPSAVYRFGKFARRNKVSLLAAMIVAFALVGGTALSLVQASKAKANARQATGVSKFLVNLLASPDPYKSGRDITVAQVLEQGAKELDKKFNDDPLTKAALLHTIGSSYRGMSRHREARPMLKQAIEIRRRELEPEHPETLASMASLVLSLHYDEALPLAQETLALRKKVLGPDHPDTLESMGDLGHVYFCAGRYEEAASTLEETVKRQKAVLGPDHIETLGTMVGLAGVYAMQGRSERMVSLDKEVLSSPTAKQYPDDPAFLAASRDIGTVYWSGIRKDEARAIWEEILPRQRARWGSDHPMTLLTIEKLAIEYRRIHRHADAIALLKQLFEAKKAKYGPNDEETLEASLELIKTYRAAGRLDDAIVQLNSLLEIQPGNKEAANILAQIQQKIAKQTQPDDKTNSGKKVPGVKAVSAKTD